MSTQQPASRSAFSSSGTTPSGRQGGQVSGAVRPPEPLPTPFDRPVAIAGGGSIGVAWTLVFARGRRKVAVFDPDPGRRSAAVAELRQRLGALAAAGLLDEEAPTIARRVEVHDDLVACLATACYVQECAPEKAEVKRALFEQLGQYAPGDAVLASSSSALPVSEIAGELACRSRCLVAHPGNPPYLLPVVELVPAPFTDPSAVDLADALLSSVGMSPVRVRREVEGFVFNRLQGAVLREAYCLVRDGVATPEDIDRVMRDGPGRRWCILGPFEVAELNTRGGVDAHARLMGPAYARMGTERGQSDPWTEEMVAEVSRSVQERFPRQAWDDNVDWRDRALMALEACRRANPVFDGPPRAAPIATRRQPGPASPTLGCGKEPPAPGAEGAGDDL
jgi:L-gulonate 3-dehydrogenase